MNPAPARAQASASGSAMASAWSRPSSWQGPAISVSGPAFETRTGPISTVIAWVTRAPPSGDHSIARAPECCKADPARPM